jgi:hypothetical protein
MGFRMAFPTVALLALAFAGCSDSGSSSGDIEASQGNERWELRLRIPGEVRAGEMAAVDLSLKNVSDETLRAHTDCISWFDVIVLNENGEQVFDWRDYIIETEYNGVAPQCPALIEELPPGKTLDQSVSFRVDEPGDYDVRPQPPNEVVGSTGQPIDLSLSVQVWAK